jgi:hypothetical protein
MYNRPNRYSVNFPMFSEYRGISGSGGINTIDLSDIGREIKNAVGKLFTRREKAPKESSGGHKTPRYL